MNHKAHLIPRCLRRGSSFNNYPNPFNPITNISYELSENSHVELKIYNTMGQEIRTLTRAYQTAGYKSVSWDGKDNSGNYVSSGDYLYRIQADQFVQTKKMLLIK
jgi:flagellar hook assembly protein FlgD